MKEDAHTIIQPLSRVDNCYNMKTLKRAQIKSQNDVMACRLKNKERQRRYRARKRLQADTRNAYLRSSPTQLQTEPQPSGLFFKSETPVRRHRNWKKDARKACISKDLENTSIGLSAPAISLSIEDIACSLCLDLHPCVCDVHLQLKEEPPFSSKLDPSGHEINGATRWGRRDWKAAARNKVDRKLVTW